MDTLYKPLLILATIFSAVWLSQSFYDTYETSGRRYRERFLGCALSALVALGGYVVFGGLHPEMLSDSLAGLVAGTVFAVVAGLWLRDHLNGATVFYTRNWLEIHRSVLSPLAVLVSLPIMALGGSWSTAFAFWVGLAVASLGHWIHVSLLVGKLGLPIYEERVPVTDGEY